MSLRCKPGDLAIFIKARLPENVGRICHVECADPEDYGVWWVTMVNPARTVDEFGRIYTGEQTARALDEWLRPIRPGDESELEPSETEVTA